MKIGSTISKFIIDTQALHRRMRDLFSCLQSVLGEDFQIYLINKKDVKNPYFLWFVHIVVMLLIGALLSTASGFYFFE